jgi:hypothetical protein
MIKSFFLRKDRAKAYHPGKGTWANDQSPRHIPGGGDKNNIIRTYLKIDSIPKAVIPASEARLPTGRQVGNL